MFESIYNALCLVVIVYLILAVLIMCTVWLVRKWEDRDNGWNYNNLYNSGVGGTCSKSDICEEVL